MRNREQAEDRTSAAFGRLAHLLVTHRVMVLLVSLVATGVMGFFASGFTVNSANEYFFLPGDELLIRYDDFKERFGSDEFTYVLFDHPEAGDFFAPEPLTTIRSFCETVEERVPHVTRVTSILDVESIDSEEDTIVVEPLFGGTIPTDAARLTELKRRALAHPTYTQLFISKDARHAGVLIENEIVEHDGTYRRVITNTIRGLVDSATYAPYRGRVVGPAVMDADVDRIITTEMWDLGLLSGLIIFAILAITFRRVADVVAPLLIIAVTNVWIVGLMAISDVPLTIMSIVLPGLITVVGCGDAIHIISEYRIQVVELKEVKEAIYEALRRAGVPCLFTSLTTMVGFGSLMIMDLRPGREMGMFAALGVVVAFLATVIMLPPLLSFSSTERIVRAETNRATKTLRWLLAIIAEWPIRQRHSITVVSSVLLMLSVVGITQVIVSADFIKIFDESTRIRQDYQHVESTLGGTATIEIVLDTKKEGGVFEPKFLEQLDAFETWLSAHPMTVSTQSLLDVLKELNRVNGGDDSFYRIPESRQAAAQLFLLYEMGGAEHIDTLVTPDRGVAHLTVRVKSAPSVEFKRFSRNLNEWTAVNFDSGTVILTGMVPLFVKLIEYITRSQLFSFGLAFIAVAVMMALLFRSVGFALLAMVPNILPITMTLGFMGATGIHLNIGTVMIASIAIGIAVDDSIHFVSHFRYYRSRGAPVADAIRKSIGGVGQALMFTSLVLALGFSVFGLSDIAHLVFFGLLTALTVIFALAADFLLLPALLLLLEKEPTRTDRAR